jgi:hypothetical protein
MATRLTSAQKREARDAAHRENQQREWEAFSKGYPERFAAVLFFAATTPDLFVVAQNATKHGVAASYTFKLENTWNPQPHTLPVTLPLEYSNEIIEALESVESKIDAYMADIEEEKRKEERRKAAQARLTAQFDAEELELLGFNNINR